MSRAKSKVAPHVHQADPDTPADPVSGDQVCRSCRLVGRPGDAHHTMPDPVPDPRTGDDS
jgi:hypothetical protein